MNRQLGRRAGSVLFVSDTSENWFSPFFTPGEASRDLVLNFFSNADTRRHGGEAGDDADDDADERGQ